MRLRPILLLAALLALLPASVAFAANDPAIIPLNEIHPGMKGVMYTIFSGDQVEQVNLTVIGILDNALGPKQDLILVQLEGPEAEKTGVVAGMSGSPVYFDGKLAGALSTKLGTFTKDAIGGVTPIQNMLDVARAAGAPAAASNFGDASISASSASSRQLFPEKIALGSGNFLKPIETPLIFSGISSEVLAQFAPQFQSYGMAMMPGGTVPPAASDANLQPGDMVSMDLISGDITAGAGCTVTAIIHDKVFVCGHPILGYGNVNVPMSRAHVVMTLASSLESTKITNTGGAIGAFTQDRVTAVVGALGPVPPTIPVEVNFKTPSETKQFHFKVAESPQLTPLLVALAANSGISANPAYTDGTTLQLNGQIEIHNHPAVELRGFATPSDSPAPASVQLALALEADFAKIYTNPYEQPSVEKVVLNVTSKPGRHIAAIDGAWCDKSQAQPGDTLHVKVLLRPYRGEPYIREVPITIPEQASRGRLEVLVSDAEVLDRARQPFPGGGQAQLYGLDELIGTINRERQNDHLYVTLLQNSPTLLIEDKELPSIPASQLNVLDGIRTPGGPRMLFQSAIRENSVEMHEVISGEQLLSITIK